MKEDKLSMSGRQNQAFKVLCASTPLLRKIVFSDVLLYVQKANGFATGI